VSESSVTQVMAFEIDDEFVTLVNKDSVGDSVDGKLYAKEPEPMQN
jgi:hypothetical protein